MSFRYIENLLHKQRNSKTKLKRRIYLVQYVYKNISLKYRSSKSIECHQPVNFIQKIFSYLENGFLSKTIHRQHNDDLNIFSIIDLQQDAF